MPSVIQARRAVALSAIAGLGVYRPPASTPSAKRLTGSDVTGVSNRVRAEHGLTTASLAAGAAREADRKSTRLNSSHEWSSYAVFCLEKNNRPPTGLPAAEPRRSGPDRRPPRAG